MPEQEAPPAASNEEEAILQAVMTNLQGLREENVELAMSAIDPDSLIYDSTRSFSEQLFALYDLEYEVLELTVETISGTEASVHFIQVTRKVSGPDFRDNRVEGAHLLHKVDGSWLIYETRVDSVDYLN